MSRPGWLRDRSCVLAFSYPVDDADQLRALIGSIDFRPNGGAL